MVYGMAWRTSHVKWPMSAGGPVHTYQTPSQVEGLLHACSVHTYSSCSFLAGIVNRFIDHCSGIDISTFTVIVC